MQARMDNGCRGRDWPDVVGRHDVRLRSRGIGFGAGIAAYWLTRHWLICDRGMQNARVGGDNCRRRGRDRPDLDGRCDLEIGPRV
jgi:hypothetical protein